MWTYIPYRSAGSCNLLLLLLLLLILLLWLVLLLHLQVKSFPFVLAFGKKPGQRQEEEGATLSFIATWQASPTWKVWRDRHHVSHPLHGDWLHDTCHPHQDTWLAYNEGGGIPTPYFSSIFPSTPCIFQRGNPSSNHPNMVRAFQGAWQYFSNFFHTVAMVTGVLGYHLL